MDAPHAAPRGFIKNIKNGSFLTDINRYTHK